MTTTTASPQIINDVIPRTQAIATAGQTVFNTNWTASSSTDILVYRRADGVDADDQTQLVSQNDYEVEFVGSLQTVRITFTDACDLDDIVTISRDTPADRTNLYTNTNFTPSMLNQDFGILTLVDQQSQLYDEQLAPHYNTSASFTDTNDLEIDTILPILDANEFWVKNPSNTAITKAVLDSSSLPAAGPFITYAADSSLTGDFNLGLLTNGILAQTVSSGTSTPYIISLPVSVDKGGTGNATLTAYAVMLGGTSSTNPMQQVSGVGTSGQLLTSNGAGLPPSWQSKGAFNVQVFTASGTYTPTTGTTRILVELVGGGGGSGGCGATAFGQAAVSGGGGAGGFSQKYVSSPVVTTVTIGAGGAGGTAGNNNGSTGGTTSFGAVFNATGGTGGHGMASTTDSSSIAGVGGTGVSGDINIYGGDGGSGRVVLSAAFYYNYGGASHFSGSRAPSLTPNTPLEGYAYGGGAAGLFLNQSSAAAPGAAGADGICIVYEFH